MCGKLWGLQSTSYHYRGEFSRRFYVVGICPVADQGTCHAGGETNCPEPRRWRVIAWECELQPPESAARALPTPGALEGKEALPAPAQEEVAQAGGLPIIGKFRQDPGDNEIQPLAVGTAHLMEAVPAIQWPGQEARS